MNIPVKTRESGCYIKSGGGVSSARNLGLDNARGEWLTFCDSDDYVDINWLSNYDIDSHLEYDIICQGFKTDRVIDQSDTNHTHSYSFDYDGNIAGFLEEIIQRGMLGYVWHKMFRKSIIDNTILRFDESMKCQEDVKFTVDYLLICRETCGKAIAVNLQGYNYNVPDWDSKYKGEMANQSYYLETLMMIIDFPDIPETKKSYFRHFTTNFYDSFINSNFGNKMKLCKLYRSLLKRDFRASPMNILPKGFILIDPTAILSSIFLDIFLKLKKHGN